MARHLREKDVGRVIDILDGWQQRLTWEALCEACKPFLRTKPARQTLARFGAIRRAFKATKQRLSEQGTELRAPVSLKVAADRILRLESELGRLRRENNQLIEQFVVWQYNAHAHGMTDRQLNQPLPRIDRGRTD